MYDSIMLDKIHKLNICEYSIDLTLGKKAVKRFLFANKEPTHTKYSQMFQMQ